MAKLTSKQRKALPASEFALPGGRYPVPDEGHAMAARGRVEEFGTPEEKKKVFARTAKFFKGKNKNLYGA